MAVLTRGFASEHPARTALVDDHGELTWAELDRAVNRTIHALRAAGLGSGDTISIVSGNRNEWFVAALACANAGITFVPVNWHLVGPEIAYIVADSGSRAVLVDHLFLDEVERALSDALTSGVEVALVAGAPSTGRFTNFDDFIATHDDGEPEEQAFGGPMFYTSGTTGNPKGVKGSLTAMPEGTGPEIWQLIVSGFSAMLETPGVTLLCGPV